MRIARGILLPRSVASHSVAPSKLSAFSVRSVTPPLPRIVSHSFTGHGTNNVATDVMSSVTLTPSPHSANPRVSPSPSIQESLWAPAETDDNYEPSILVASPSVQSISFPKPQDISYHLIHRPCVHFSRAEPTAYVLRADFAYHSSTYVGTMIYQPSAVCVTERLKGVIR